MQLSNRVVAVATLQLFVWPIALIAVLFGGCAPKVLRNANTFVVEQIAAEKRQIEAAEVMLEYAERFAAVGDVHSCIKLAGPALLIEAAADRQSSRALYLARLLDEDPGPSPEPRPVTAICGDLP